MNLASLDDIKVYLGEGIEGSTQADAVLLNLISRVSARFAAYCGRDFGRCAVTASGTATGTTAYKLVDSGANFGAEEIPTAVGMRAKNKTDGTYATVTAIDSTTQLSLDADIMAQDESYEVREVKVEYFDGIHCRSLIQLKAFPVRTSEPVRVWDDLDREYGDDDLVDSDDYAVDAAAGLVMLDPGFTFSEGRRNLKVVYEGPDWTEVPQDLRFACELQVAFEYKRKDELGVLSVADHGGSITRYQPQRFLPEVQETLDAYRKVTFP